MGIKLQTKGGILVSSYIDRYEGRVQRPAWGIRKVQDIDLCVPYTPERLERYGLSIPKYQSMLNEFSKKCSPEQLARVVLAPLIAPYTLARLATHPDTRVRMFAASSLNCRTQTLAQLSIDKEPQVRLAAAGNTKCSPEVLARLAQDPDPSVRRSVAGNSSCPWEILSALSMDPDFDVCTRVAANPSCPGEVLGELSASNDPDEICARVAANPSCPQEILDKLSTNSSPSIRRDAALHVQSPRVLYKLALDPDPQVVEAVVENPGVPAEILVKIGLESTDPDLLYLVSTRPNCPPEVRELLLLST